MQTSSQSAKQNANSYAFKTAYHQLSANEFFSMSSIERKTYSSIERRFSVHSPILTDFKNATLG